MQPFTFADILFLFLTLIITFTILWFVNKAKGKRSGMAENIKTESTATSDTNER